MGVLTLGGCVCAQNVCTPTGASAPAVVFATQHEPTTVTLLRPVVCGEVVPERATTSVTGPRGETIEHTAAAPVSKAGTGFEVAVTFAAPVPGDYHLLARFEPSLGVAQLDVRVAAERRDAGFVAVPLPCTHGDFTPQGLALCGTPAATTVYSNGALIETLPAGAVHAAGAIWALAADAGAIERWVEDGGALEHVASTPGVFFGTKHLLPSRDDLVLLGLANVWWVDGGTALLPETLIVPTGAAVWRDGDRLTTLEGSASPATRGWCRQLLDGGQRSCSSQATQVLTLVGNEPRGLWAEEELLAGSQVAFFTGDVLQTFALPEGWHLGPLPARLDWDHGAFIGFDGGGGDVRTFVLSVTCGDISLENYGNDVRGISSTCVISGGGDGGVRLLRR